MTEDACKLCRTIATHGGEWMDGAMVARWCGEDGERLGYRRLARWVNLTVLERAMERAGLPTAGDEAASRYDRLTGEDEDVARGVREVLREEGVPVDELKSAFVSYGVVRSHLLDCLEAERPEQESADWEADAVAAVLDRAADRVHAAVRARYNKGRLDAGDVPDVDVSVTLACPTCGSSGSAVEVLESGALCDCST